MHDPLVSVSCITYNHAPFIRQCLDGILDQKCRFNFEVLIYDDASTDGTIEIILEYAERFPDIVKPLIQKENQYSKGIRGIAARFNFSRAKGKYIAMCEGDDYWVSTNKLQAQVQFLEENETFSATYHDTEVMYDEYNKKSHLFRNGLPDSLGTTGTLAFLAPFHTSSFLFRKDYLEIPDWMFNVESVDMAMFSIVSKRGRLKKIPAILSVYRKHSGGITNTSPHTTHFNDKRIELMKYLDAYHDYKYKSKIKHVVDQHTLGKCVSPLLRLVIKLRIKYWQKFKKEK